MAHFAKLGVGNIVEQVIVVSNDIATTEQAGVDFINKLYNTRDVWKQTSYNTRNGKYYNNSIEGDQTKEFRKNYAGIGYHYDQARDAFIPPKPFNSWILNEDTCNWESPITKPQDENNYIWNESTLTWNIVEV
jgi:hypothetical protein